MIDFHVHSHYSPDAESSPAALINAALRAGVRLLSITDHNGIDHIEPALDAAAGKALRLLPGLELTCASPAFGLDEIHILAHFQLVDNSPWRHSALEAIVAEIAAVQAQNLTSLLRGLDIPVENLERARQSLIQSGQLAAVARPSFHLFKRCARNLSPFPWAEMKLKRDHVITDLRKDNLWYPFPSVDHVLQVLNSVGATATLAHPGRYALDADKLSTLLDSLKSQGLMGLEAIYFPQFDSSHSFISLARAKGCFITAGSDSHSARSMLLPSYIQLINSAAALTNSPWRPDKM
ncbi:MAG: PHP domain-containing protein [Acidobacteria bacterium]|nr:PHP domain-containing protein [Acidobacteriota bacterium]